MKDCIETTRYLMGKYPVEIVKCGEADFGEYVDECPEQQNCLRAKILQDCTITLMAVDYDEDGAKPDLVPLPDTLRKGEIRCFPAMWLHKKSSLKPSQRRTSRMIQHQLFIWKNEAIGGCRVLCGECRTFFDSTLTKLAEGETCPNCKAMYADIDVDETGQCNHGIIGNGEVFTIKRLINSKQSVGKKPISESQVKRV